MKQYYFISISAFLLLLFAGCSKNINNAPPLVDENNNGFETPEVATVFAKNCALTGCHGGTDPHHGLSLASFSNLIKGSNSRPLSDSSHIHKASSDEVIIYGGSPIVPYKAGESLLYNMITGNVVNPDHKMPYKLAPISPNEIEIVKNWINNGARDNNGNPAYSSSNQKVYVCSQGSDKIIEIDQTYNVISRIIPVDFVASVSEAPHNIQQYGDYIYTSLIGTGRLLKLNKFTGNLVSSVSGIERAGMIEISSDGKKAFVSRSSTSPGIYNTIYAVNLETMAAPEAINLPVTGVPHAIALRHDDSLLYVANLTKDRISIINAQTNEIAEDDIILSNTGTLVYEPMHMYLSPDDKYLYINCRTAKMMLIYDTETKTEVARIDIKDHPMQSAISSDGNKIYTVSHHEQYITEITKSGSTWTKSFEFNSHAFSHLYGASLSADGKYLYVTCSNDDDTFKSHYQIPGQPNRSALVCVYSTQTKELIKVLDAGNYATGISAR